MTGQKLFNFNLINLLNKKTNRPLKLTCVKCRDTLKYTRISNTKHNVNTQHIQQNKKYLAVWE